MKARNKYLLLVFILHTLCLTQSFYIFRENKIWFVVAEIFILISAGLSWQLYREMIHPLKLLLQGADAIRDQDFNIKFVSTGKNEMNHLITIYNQMIDELRRERTKQEEQHFFLDKLIMSSPVGMIILDYDKNIQQINPKANSLLNVDNGTQQNELKEILLHEITLLIPDKAKYISFSAKRYKLQLSYFLDRGFYRYFVILEELSEEIASAEKQAYAKVIRMMSHEVTNTIGPVNSILQSALILHPDAKTSNNLSKAMQAAMDRNDNLNVFMRNMADVVRIPQPSKKPTDVHRLLKTIVRLFEEITYGKNIFLSLHLRKQDFEIMADALQMEQVAVNIIKNSIDAIGTQAEGRIQIITEAQPSKIIIRDNGKGLPPEDEFYSFSPFFTDKKEGQGIGLTMTKEILMNHGYQFSLSTKKMGQTDFVIICSI